MPRGVSRGPDTITKWGRFWRKALLAVVVIVPCRLIDDAAGRPLGGWILLVEAVTLGWVWDTYDGYRRSRHDHVHDQPPEPPARYCPREGGAR
jgi:hypothetical protein